MARLLGRPLSRSSVVREVVMGVHAERITSPREDVDFILEMRSDPLGSCVERSKWKMVSASAGHGPRDPCHVLYEAPGPRGSTE